MDAELDRKQGHEWTRVNKYVEEIDCERGRTHLHVVSFQVWECVRYAAHHHSSVGLLAAVKLRENCVTVRVLMVHFVHYKFSNKRSHSLFRTWHERCIPET